MATGALAVSLGELAATAAVCLFDHFDAVFMGAIAVILGTAWWRLTRRGRWVVAAHRTVILVLFVSALVVAYRTVGAIDGSGPRVGSESVGYRSGEGGVVGYLESQPINPDRVPSARLLNSRGMTTVSSVDGGPAWPALTRATFQVSIPAPPRGAGLAIVFAGAVSLVPWFLGLVALERLLRRARHGVRFSGRDIRDLRWLAFAVSGAVYVGVAVDHIVAEWVLGVAGVGLNLGAYSQNIEHRLVFPLTPLVAGALIFSLAELWRQAIMLREDAEATV